MKYDYDFVKSAFENRGYKLISECYRNTNEKLQYTCLKHPNAGVQNISFPKLYLRGQGCKFCGDEKRAQKRRISLDTDEYRKLCEKNGFEYVDTKRVDGVIKIFFVCPKHRDLGIQSTSKSNMTRGMNGCQYCFGKKLPVQYVLDKLNKINPSVELLEPYQGLTKRIKCRCKIHNVISNKTPNEILQGKGCYICGREKLSAQSFLTLDEFQSKVFNANSAIKVLEYYGEKKNAKFQCMLCGYIWESSAESMIMHGKRCPECQHFYAGEKLVKSILEYNGIGYIEQFRFKDCRDKRTLPFDFYIPQYNMCIEYDGQQHFKPVFGEKSFKDTVRHDRMKDKYCSDRGIDLLRISYKDAESIEKIINERISLIKNKLSNQQSYS